MREEQLRPGQPREFMIMFYERPYTSLGEKIATVIGLLMLMVALSVFLVGAHLIMHIA